MNIGIILNLSAKLKNFNEIEKAVAIATAFCIGRSDRIWTDDLYHPKVARYQSAPHPDIVYIIPDLDTIVKSFQPK